MTELRCGTCGQLDAGEWVSVKDRLPDECKRYIVIHSDIEPEYCVGFSTFYPQTQEFNHNDVTHWREPIEPPIPEVGK